MFSSFAGNIDECTYFAKIGNFLRQAVHQPVVANRKYQSLRPSTQTVHPQDNWTTLGYRVNEFRLRVKMSSPVVEQNEFNGDFFLTNEKIKLICNNLILTRYFVADMFGLI